MIKKRFGFVQYSDVACAQKALNCEQVVSQADVNEHLKLT